jgi:hypothetical protein
MGSRLFWIMLTGVALVAGAALQGNMLFDMSDDLKREKIVEARVDRAVDERLVGMKVVDSEGRTIAVSPDTKKELGHAVKRLVAAEAELALLRIKDGDEADIRTAHRRSEASRAEVDRLKAQIDREEQLSDRDRQAVRDQIREEVRETVRSAVRG